MGQDGQTDWAGRYTVRWSQCDRMFEFDLPRTTGIHISVRQRIDTEERQAIGDCDPHARHLPTRTTILASFGDVLRAQTLDTRSLSRHLSFFSFSLDCRQNHVDDIVRHREPFAFLSSLLLWSKTSTTKDFSLSFLSFISLSLLASIFSLWPISNTRKANQSWSSIRRWSMSFDVQPGDESSEDIFGGDFEQ